MALDPNLFDLRMVIQRLRDLSQDGKAVLPDDLRAAGLELDLLLDLRPARDVSVVDNDVRFQRPVLLRRSTAANIRRRRLNRPAARAIARATRPSYLRWPAAAVSAAMPACG